MSTLTITLIQPDLHWEDKTANLQMLSEKINGIRERTEVVILPEMFTTGFSMNPGSLAETMDGTTVQWMKKTAAEKNIILTGSVIIEDTSGDPSGEKKYFNRLIWMLPTGEYGFYDKRHLFAYGKEDLHYHSGNKRLIASVKGWKLNLLVCYDLRFPVWSRQSCVSPQSYPEYDVLIYVANWPQKRSHAWETLLQARAIENQCYTVGVNRVGQDGNGIYYGGGSMVVDPPGNIIYKKENEEAVFTCLLKKDALNEVRDQFPFWKSADLFNINGSQ